MKFIKWLLCVIGVEAIGSLSGLFAGDIKSMYAQLNKPPLAPPGNLVGIVWPILYAMIGTALYLILTSPDSQLRKKALQLFAVQMVLNFIWSILFFGGDYFWIASVISLALTISVFACYKIFENVHQTAAWLFIPYLIWLLYATYLSFGLAVLN